MAHQNPVVPIRKRRTEPVAWPSPQERADQAVTSPETAAEQAAVEQAIEVYRTSVATAERLLRDLQQKLSRTAASVADTVRTFGNERPLHLIAIVAGASFVAGVALRIRRAKPYA